MSETRAHEPARAGEASVKSEISPCSDLADNGCKGLLGSVLVWGLLASRDGVLDSAQYAMLSAASQ